MPHDLNVMYSRNTDNWKTPTKIYKYFTEKLNCIDCFKYESKENQFRINYHNQKLFVNPPFSKMKEVVNWLIAQYHNRNTIYLLIPARTDTKYFHELLYLKPIIQFIKGRLHYNDSKSAPFPTILMILDIKNANNYHADWQGIDQENISI